MDRIEDLELNAEKRDREKRTRSLKKRVTKLNTIVKRLENNLMETNQNDKYMLCTIRNDAVQNQKLTTQLEEAQKENKQLLNVLQQQHNDGDLSRSTSRSQIDISPTYSTISMVHLQYKYEELLSSHEGLLKVLEMRLREMQNSCNENVRLRDEIDSLNVQANDLNGYIRELSNKYRMLKERKDRKISKLKYERNALKEVHGKLLAILEKQRGDIETYLTKEMKTTNEPTKALLLNEIRKNNLLEYENIELRRQLQIVKLQFEDNERN